jgi:hypothetical protein
MTVNERRAYLLELYDRGLSQRDIAEQVGMPTATVAYDLKRVPGYKPRETLATFAPGDGRVTAEAAAKKHGLKLTTLLDAIAAGRVRGERAELAGGRVAH